MRVLLIAASVIAFASVSARGQPAQLAARSAEPGIRDLLLQPVPATQPSGQTNRAVAQPVPRPEPRPTAPEPRPVVTPQDVVQAEMRARIENLESGSRIFAAQASLAEQRIVAERQYLGTEVARREIELARERQYLRQEQVVFGTQVVESNLHLQRQVLSTQQELAASQVELIRRGNDARREALATYHADRDAELRRDQSVLGHFLGGVWYAVTNKREEFYRDQYVAPVERDVRGVHAEAGIGGGYYGAADMARQSNNQIRQNMVTVVQDHTAMTRLVLANIHSSLQSP